jgi:hypothetical protein
MDRNFKILLALEFAGLSKNFLKKSKFKKFNYSSVVTPLMTIVKNSLPTPLRQI